MKKALNKKGDSDKLRDLDRDKVSPDGVMTTDQGLPIGDDQKTLKAGERGPVLLEDFLFREKVMHFDHERIPERIVHARGFGAHGRFRVYESMSKWTRAHFLSDPSLETPVFVRFSTVAGFRGSADTVRDVRGFAVKFYTQEGNYDLVGNNMPVFFLHDAIKFPDLIHALKPEPHNEIPQAQSAHDTFWDFVGRNHETAHNVMWLMSDRGIPRSFRMMEGFGIHTFKFVNDKGKAKFVKFHWKPLLGVHSLVWDESQRIAGKDPDFHRRDLWEAIETGNAPEWELGVQILDPADAAKFPIDILDATKLWPEELVPVERIGRMTLDRNVTNFFAETEQIAFCPANLVPGIELTDDPLLQGRLFSYLDTQLSRLGGPNFHEIPINRPLVPVRNNQRDGLHRMTINPGVSSYFRNSMGGGEPHPATRAEGAYDFRTEEVTGRMTRERSQSFFDYYSQPTLFWHSMSVHEKKHIVDAFVFELGKCSHAEVRQAVVDMLNKVDGTLASEVAAGLGLAAPARPYVPNDRSTSPALSMADTAVSAATRKVAVLVAHGFDRTQYDAVAKALASAGACMSTVAEKFGPVESAQGEPAQATQTFATVSSVLYDAVCVIGGRRCAEAISVCGDAVHFVTEAFKHYKPIGFAGEASNVLETAIPAAVGADGVVTGARAGAFASAFVAALETGRFWSREPIVGMVSA